MLAIGPYELRNPVLLAPMAGVTDVPFRKLAWDCGVGYQVGEMVSDNPRLWDSAKSKFRRQPLYHCGPQVMQIAGSVPQQVADAAVLQWQTGAQIVDLNFGCPAKKVCRKAAGSALLADPALVQAIAGAVVSAVPIPVTAKIRTGPTPNQRNALDIGMRLQDAGIAALAIHGRTRACKFNGHAEMDTLAAVAAALNIPVFANGDITGCEQAVHIMSNTDAAGVMVGRGALGAPWLLGQMAACITGQPQPATPTVASIVAMMQTHLAHIHNFYGLSVGARFARKHIGWYLQYCAMDQAKRPFNHLATAQAQSQALDWLAELCDAQLSLANQDHVTALAEDWAQRMTLDAAAA